MNIPLNYTDVEVRIHKGGDDGYPLELTVDSAQQFEGGLLSRELLPWVPGESPRADGERLFNWLFRADPAQQAWAQIRGRSSQRRVRLRIDAAAPELHAIPWELLRDAGDAAPLDLAATEATPFSRYLAGRWLPGSPIIKRPIKILLAVADAANLEEYDLTPIDAGQEWAVLQEALDAVDGVRIDRLEGPSALPALEAALRQGYHILHLVAHGMYSKRRDQTVLYLADDDNQVNLVNGEELAAMLTRQLADAETQREDKLRLVFLASCQSATNSPADAFRAVAPALVTAGVPAVVAMQDLVPVETAQAFSRTFYQRLMVHGYVDLASNEARSTVTSAGLHGASMPVLFMRLRNGQLLGQRGRITGDRSEMFWPFLLENIRIGHCIPFVGPRMTEGLLPSGEQIAEQLAEKYRYPMATRSDLAKVAQYVALNDPQLLRTEYIRTLRRSLFAYLGLKPTAEDRKRFGNANFSETASGLNWAEKVLDVQENEVHHLLADLRLPLYITTNPDSFMFEALKARGLDPRRFGPRWEQVEAGTPQYTLQPEPSPQQPVVFHLNGYDDDPEQERHLVLSEDDHLAQMVRMSRDQDYILPMNVIRALGESSYLFLGYSLNDWEFRVILEGLVKSINRPTKLNVGVQLEEDPNLDADKVIDYFRRYLGQFNIEIYWGSSHQFVSELHAEWQQQAGDPGPDGEDMAGGDDEW